MLWHKVQGAGGIFNGDPYWTDVSLLLKGEGANGSTTILDSSTNSLTVTPQSGVSISTSQFKFGSSSIFFDGGSSYLDVGNPSVLNFGSGDYTLEGFFNFSSASGDRGLFAKYSTTPATTGINLRYAQSVGGLRLVVGGTGTTLAQNASFSPSTGVWYHIAYTRSGTNHRVFINGTSVLSSSVAVGDVDTTAAFVVGSAQTVPNSEFFGYMDEVRVTKGAARYTANFSEPTQPFPAY